MFKKYRILLGLFIFSMTLLGIIYLLNPNGPELFYIKVRPFPATRAVEPGEYPLGLGGYRRVNRSIIWRDGLLYIPEKARSGVPLPLLVWLHGGGGNAESFRYMFPLAEKSGVVILALDARHNTWDGIDSPFGPDVLFIDEALQSTFAKVEVDPQKIALGGLSDGASYTLAIGRVNGDLFTHLIAVAPGWLRPPQPDSGSPKILVAHGLRDNVYHYMRSRKYVVPYLRKAGYNVTYWEFDGPHWLPEPEGRKVLDWLVQ